MIRRIFIALVHTAGALLEKLWSGVMTCLIGLSLLLVGCALVTGGIYGMGVGLLYCGGARWLDLGPVITADGMLPFDRVMTAGVVGYSLLMLCVVVVALVVKVCRFTASIVHVFRKKFKETK